MTWLDVETGEVRFDDLTLVFGPRLSRRLAWLHPDWARLRAPTVADVEMKTGPALTLTFEALLGGAGVEGRVHFDEQRLASVRIVARQVEPGQRKAVHDQWVRDVVGGTEQAYAWGMVGSYLPPEGDGPRIVIGYYPRTEPTGPVRDEVLAAAEEIERVMREHGMWDRMPAPEPEAFASTKAFRLDTMVIEQWLKYVFLPRVRELAEAGDLPAHSEVSQQYWREYQNEDGLFHEPLLRALRAFDALFTPR